MFSTCLMLSPPHFNSSRWPSSNNQAGGSSDISQKLFRIYLMQFLVCHLQKNCRFQEQLLSFFMEDVFGQLQLKICREIRFVEELHSLRQQLSRCVSTPSKYGDVEPRNLPRNQHVGIFLNIEGWGKGFWTVGLWSKWRVYHQWTSTEQALELMKPLCLLFLTEQHLRHTEDLK